MLVQPVAAALGVLLGAAATIDVGLSGEARNLSGGPPGAPVGELVPYTVAPSAGIRLDFDPRLTIGMSLDSRLFLLAPSAGSYAVHDVARYGTGSAFVAWRTGVRHSLTLAGHVSRGTLQTSPLAQLDQSNAPPGSGTPPGQPPAPLNPSAGLRTAQHSSAGVRASADWQIDRTFTLAGAAGYSQGGGVGELDRIAFPRGETVTGDLSIAWTVGPLGTAGAALLCNRTHLDALGTATLLDFLGRWDQQILRDTSVGLRVGMVVTVESANRATRSLSDLGPRFEGSITKAAPAEGRGLGATLRLGYGPFVDVYSGAVRQRLSGHASADWMSSPLLRISLTLAGATSIDSGRVGPSVGAMEVAIWSIRRPALEFGLALRTGFQEGGQPTSITRQWGVSAAVRWSTRSTF